MKIKVRIDHLLFLGIYGFTILTLLLFQINELPFSTILRKTKYGYVVGAFMLFLFNCKIKKNIILPLFVWGLFFLHTILFGFIYTNQNIVPMAFENIHTNATQMTWVLLIVLVTFLYVSQNNIFSEFITTSFYVTGIQLFIAIMKHREDIVNPIWGLKQSFAGGIRFKTTFGFVHPGYVSNAAYLVLILSIFFYELHRYDLTKKWIVWISIIIIDGMAVEMLMAAAERSGIISTFMVFAVYDVFVLLRVRMELKTKIIIFIIGVITIIILAATGVFSYIWANSNRMLNITVNYPIFQRLGNIWTGMGYVDNSGFHADVLAFGEVTSSLDIYYVYLFFTTGIIGCAIIAVALLIILIRLIFKKKDDLNITVLGLYSSMLFFAFWQCNLVTYRYVSSSLLFLIVLLGMTDDFCVGDGKSLLIERSFLNERERE